MFHLDVLFLIVFAPANDDSDAVPMTRRRIDVLPRPVPRRPATPSYFLRQNSFSNLSFQEFGQRYTGLGLLGG